MQLPEARENILQCELSALQKVLYLQTEKHLLFSQGADGATKQRRMTNRVSQLRKVCNHPFLFPEYDMGDDLLIRSCGKFALLDKILPKLKFAGHRVLIYSQMVPLFSSFFFFFSWREGACAFVMLMVCVLGVICGAVGTSYQMPLSANVPVYDLLCPAWICAAWIRSDVLKHALTPARARTAQVKLLHLLQRYCCFRQYHHLVLSGETSSDDRIEMMRKWNAKVAFLSVNLRVSVSIGPLFFCVIASGPDRGFVVRVRDTPALGLT
eukprot:2859165-Rhodomonas_salina.2